MGKKSRLSAKKKSASSHSGGGGGRKKSNTNNNGNTSGRRGDPFGTSSESHAHSNDSSYRPFQSIYQVYKAATSRFKEQLKLASLPLQHRQDFNLDYVKSFIDAVDYIKENCISIDTSMLQNLRVAISVRNKYSKYLDGGGDEGHRYFLLVLNYCLQVLKQCPMNDDIRTAAAEERRDGKTGQDTAEDEDILLCNRFDALYEDDEQDDEEEDDNDTTPVRPQPSSTQYSYDDLMHFPTKTKCLFLFETMAYHAHRYTTTLKNLKETLRLEADGKYPTDRVPVEIMCQGMFANSMIRNVQELERSLYIDCPGLDESPYRVLVCCFMSPLVNLVSDSVKTKSPLAKKWKDEYALALFGDVVEAVFRFNLRQGRQLDDISNTFVKRWKMPNSDKIRWLIQVVMRITLKNAGTKAEDGLFRFQPCTHTDPLLDSFPEWMSEEELENDFLWTSIKGDRSILNTMRIIDGVAAAFVTNADDEFSGVMCSIMNGNVWDDTKNPASAITGELDSTLLSMMFHLTKCKWRFDGLAVPMEKLMLPLVSLMRQQSFFKPKPSFAFIFAAHAMLTSIFELQGEGDVFRVKNLAKGSFDRFMAQAGEHLELKVPCHNRREECLKFIVDTKRVTEKSDDADVEKEPLMIAQEYFDLLIWNPMSAGMLLSYTNVYLSLEGGFTAMTTSEDLSAILHIYHALKYHELVDDNLPLLGDIDRYFNKTYCVWNGWEKPEQGKFVYRLNLSMGLTNEMAKYSQDRARFNYKGGEKPIKPTVTLLTIERTRTTSKRVSTTIDPSEISNCFRRYCLHDFKSCEDDEGPIKPLEIDPKLSYPIPWQIHEANTRLIFASLMSEFDSRLLKYNMVAVGTVLTQFLYDTFKPDDNENVAKFAEMVKVSGFPNADHAGNVQSLINLSIAEDILAGLDYAPNPEKFAYVGEAFEEFFYNLDMNRVCIINNDDEV